jgi:hypothetical protein
MMEILIMNQSGLWKERPWPTEPCLRRNKQCCQPRNAAQMALPKHFWTYWYSETLQQQNAFFFFATTQFEQGSFMSVVIRTTNWKAGESGSDFCLAETFLLVIVRQVLQPTIFLTIKNRELLIWCLTCLALLLNIHLRQVPKVKND